MNNIDKTNLNLSLNRSVNASYKPNINTGLIDDKHSIIFELNNCTYRTSPKVIATLLENLFRKWPSKEGHWLYIAQHYAPRPINRVIAKIIKQYQRGDRRIENPAKYFTYLIKFREKRKSFRETNDTCKQPNQYEEL